MGEYLSAVERMTHHIYDVDHDVMRSGHCKGAKFNILFKQVKACVPFVSLVCICDVGCSKGCNASQLISADAI